MSYTYLRTTFFSLVFVTLFGYIVHAVYTTLLGPSIAFLSPRPYEVSTNGGYTLSGGASHFVSLTLNGRRVVTRPDGTFEERMLLAPGTNTFVVDAVDSFGTHTSSTATIVYKPETERETETARIVPLVDTLQF
jgi:hypothetical protein